VTTSRERLMATLRGEPVDRPALSFYEIGGMRMNTGDPDPFNVYNDPSWLPLTQLALEKTDLIRMGMLQALPGGKRPRSAFYTHETWEEPGMRFTRTTLHTGKRDLTQVSRRNIEADTQWVIEHFVKDRDDLLAVIGMPDEAFEHGQIDIGHLEHLEAETGERGIVMVDSADPLCEAAMLFDMSDYILAATTEPALFHRLLERIAGPIQRRTEHVAKAFPGHLWRVFGPEYAVEPYLPPACFPEYVVRYTGPMVESIRRHGGYARIHCHGRVASALPHITAMGADAIDPLEPPPQGDVLLADVRRDYGENMVLFGNIEVSDLEFMDPAAFRVLAEKTLRDGTAGEGRGFVMMPTSCPYGRTISKTTLTNYETLVNLIEAL
jgi:hypothetical protein